MACRKLKPIEERDPHAARKSSQGGYLDLDFTLFFAILVIVGVVIGIALTVGVPWVWEQVKPFIHAVTA